MAERHGDTGCDEVTNLPLLVFIVKRPDVDIKDTNSVWEE